MQSDKTKCLILIHKYNEILSFLKLLQFNAEVFSETHMRSNRLTGRNLSSNPILPLKPYSSTVSVCSLTIQTTWLTVGLWSIRIAAFCYSLSAHHPLSNNVCTLWGRHYGTADISLPLHFRAWKTFPMGNSAPSFPTSHSDMCTALRKYIRETASRKMNNAEHDYFVILGTCYQSRSFFFYLQRISWQMN